MLINKYLETLFSAPSNISVLRVLNERTVGITGRETARLTNLTHRSALMALSNLESFGVVKRVTGGRDYLFTLDRNKFITKKIISVIFNAERDFRLSLFSRIKKQLSRITISLIVFGSVARKDETIKSDLDLCIVYSKNRNKLEESVSNLREQIYLEYSIQLAPIYISEKEFIKRAKKKLSPVNNVIDEGILISGKSIKALMAEK